MIVFNPLAASLELHGEAAAEATGPLKIDHWLASRLLRKAIRRSDASLAARAALTHYRARGATVWRRFMVIAFEDIGAGCVDSLIDTVALATKADQHAQFGTDAKAAVRLASRLARAPKDESSDYLICSARNHPSLDGARELIGSRNVSERITMVSNQDWPLPVRATAAWYASGIEWTGEKRDGRGSLPALINAFRMLGVPDRFAAATQKAARRTREPITLMVPLIWLAAFGKEFPTVSASTVLAAPTLGEIPAYAFDKHTRVGKRAIILFARENDAVRSRLEEHVPDYRHNQVACVAASYADATSICPRLEWNQSHSLEALGMENDLMREGMPSTGVRPLVEATRANLDHLNAIRARLFLPSSTVEGLL